jgi:hypothetical protein
MASRNQSNRTTSTTPPPNQNATTNAITQTITALTTTPQSNLHLPALQSVLNTYPTTSKSVSVQAQFLKNLKNATSNASNKILNETPTYVHLSAKDSAPQLSLESDKLTVKGAFRGYRMVRGTHGVSSGNWYFEVMVLSPPKVSEVVKALPKNVRLGEALKEGLREGMMREREEMRNKMMQQRQQQLKQLQLMKEQQQKAKQGEASGSGVGGTNAKSTGDNEDNLKKKKRKLDDDVVNKKNANKKGSPHSIGGHLRMGWSMRTGELQAPVGYDQWSYAYRNISGSRIHNSQREDKWGGQSFGPGDIIGFAISLVDDNAITGNTTNTSALNTSSTIGGKAKNTQQQSNHIRFFKNGEAQGHFIVSRNVRTGGAAFDNIKKGTYYPAISPYMGGAARVNFGPHFIHPPRGLPSGMKVRPLSENCTPPPTADDVLEMFKKEKVFGRKVDENIVNVLHEAIRVEAKMRHDCYQKRLENHVVEVRKARTERGLTTADLPVLKEDEPMDDSKDGQETST